MTSKGNSSSSGGVGSSGHFRQLVDEETRVLTELCEKWDDYLLRRDTKNETKTTANDDENFGREDDEDSDEAAGEIRAVVGQCRMLMDSGKGRLEQFRQLIWQSERPQTRSQTSKGVKSISYQDLEGFWCMVSFQIDDLKQDFQNLEKYIQQEPSSTNDNGGNNESTAKGKSEQDEKELVRSLEALHVVNEEKKVDHEGSYPDKISS